MSDGTIETVTVAGITGVLGPAIVKALSSHGFKVQALTRKRNTEDLPAKIIEVDYQHSDNLQALLSGQDAVISCIGDTPAAVESQQALIEASIAAGVKRFIPSEFGSDTTNAKVKSYPFFKPKLQHQKLLREAAECDHPFSYTVLITGPFLDWGLSVVPFIINVGNRTAEVIDGGNAPFSVTRTPTVGNAVASILKQPAKTANRVLFIHEAVVTQSQLIALAECILRKKYRISSQFTTAPNDSRIAENKAWQAHQDPSTNPLDWKIPFINLSIWAKDEPCHFRETDNELLGVRVLEGEESMDMLQHEIEQAANVLGVEEGDQVGDTVKAESAFEAGKLKLVGY